MVDASTTPVGVPADGSAAEPTLVLMFSGRLHLGIQRRRIPRAGLLLGRAATIFDEAFTDERMAIRHAELRLDAGRVMLRDLGSETGTRLNGQPLTRERALQPGDVIRLGDT